jgi:SAM-dependent methyltransferase
MMRRFAGYVYRWIPLPLTAKENIKIYVLTILPAWKSPGPPILPDPVDEPNSAKQLQPSDHRSKVLSQISPTSQDGLEIGPLCFPAVSKSESGGHIWYVDYLTAEELREKYRDDPYVHIDQIVETDYLWGEHTLPELVEYKQFDYVIASHVIEHVPDMIGWLKEISAVLKDKGILSLVIPDKRYTFDFLREISSPGILIEAYLSQHRRPGPREIFENTALASKVDLIAAWEGKLDKTNLRTYDAIQLAFKLAQDSVQSDYYQNVHVNVFTPSSFLDLLEVISRLGLLDFAVTDFYSTTRNSLEFFISLERIPRDKNREECLTQQLASIDWARQRLSYNTPIQYPNAEFISDTTPSRVVIGKKYDIGIIVKNIGTRTWGENSKIRLCIFQDGHDFDFRILFPNGVEVKSGGIYTFKLLNFQAPRKISTYLEYQMVEEGVGFFGEKRRVDIKIE